MAHLIIAIHDSLDQLACAHIAESAEEAEAVARTVDSLGPVWQFELNDSEPLQYYADADPSHYYGPKSTRGEDD